MTPARKLWIAIVDDDPALAAEAMREGAIINGYHRGRTFLVWAVQENRMEIIELLVSNGALINKKDKDGVSPLYQAAGDGNLEVTAYLIERGADVNMSALKSTPLIVAAAFGRLEIVKLLLSYGADKKAKDSEGKNARYFAKLYRHLEIAEILLQRKGSSSG